MNKQIANLLKLLTLPVILYVIFMFLAEGFGLHSLSIVISQSMIPTMMGLGLYAMMDAGLMDFSMGARTVFGGLVGGMMAQQFGVPGLLAGCLLGAMIAAVVMALLYRWLKIPAMVISIGILLIFEVAGAKLAGSSGYVKISQNEYFIGSYPVNILIVLVVSVFAYILFYRTRIGKYITAVGNDEKMCKNLGINADNVKFVSILLTGVFCFFAAILNICYSGSITTGTEMITMNMVFKPIMCVILARYMRKKLDCMPLLIFIGGVSITIIFNGFIAMGFSEAIQDIMLGVFLIIVLGSDVLVKEFSQLRKIVEGKAV